MRRAGEFPAAYQGVRSPTQFTRRISLSVVALSTCSVMLVYLLIAVDLSLSAPDDDRPQFELGASLQSPDSPTADVSLSDSPREVSQNGSLRPEVPAAEERHAPRVFGSAFAAGMVRSKLDHSSLISFVDDVAQQLQWGTFEVIVSNPAGVQTVTVLRFHLGSDIDPPRLHTVTGPSGGASGATSERIVIGSRSWFREGKDPWSAEPYDGSVWGQVSVLLPDIRSATSVSTSESARIHLFWHDAERLANIELELDRAAGTLLSLQRDSKRTGLNVTIRYLEWNVEPDISLPSELGSDP